MKPSPIFRKDLCWEKSDIWTMSMNQYWGDLEQPEYDPKSLLGGWPFVPDLLGEHSTAAAHTFPYSHQARTWSWCMKSRWPSVRSWRIVWGRRRKLTGPGWLGWSRGTELLPQLIKVWMRGLTWLLGRLFILGISLRVLTLLELKIIWSSWHHPEVTAHSSGMNC